MTLSELVKSRQTVPYVIAGIGLLPLLIVGQPAPEGGGITKPLVAGLSIAIAFFYSLFGVRDVVWDYELDKKIHPLIKRGILRLVPADLDMTDEELAEVSRRDILKKNTGIFWETVDGNPRLSELKQHHYANGHKYTAAIDAVLLCGLAAVLYLVYFLVSFRTAWLGVAVVYAIISFGAYQIALLRYRRRHQEITQEQVERLEQLCKAPVQDRLRAIVLQRRAARSTE